MRVAEFQDLSDGHYFDVSVTMDGEIAVLDEEAQLFGPMDDDSTVHPVLALFSDGTEAVFKGIFDRKVV